MTGPPLQVELAPDCAALRRDLIERAIPPVSALPPEEARRLSREGNLAAAAAWTPPLASLPVVVDDLPVPEGLVAMRRYLPTGADHPTTTLMWLHGGGWVLGDLDTTDATARTACALTGFEVVTVDYRCAPASPFPAAARDVLAAADWLLSTRGAVVVAGDSAGGNLAGVVAQQRGSHPALVGQVLVYPCTDPSLASPSAHAFTEGPFLCRRDMQWFYDRYLPVGADRTDPLVSLVHGLARHDLPSVPAVVYTVGHDPVRDEGIDYAAELARRGHSVTWLHAPELHHGSFTNSGILPSSARRVDEVWAATTRMFT
ncbi:MAG: alpha/beta hydrolase fold domain-containing protein [Actinobacteria bacterium]|nr:alpha/beta hydrolase fold domain-containing protein [Actinomycetota bacterium]